MNSDLDFSICDILHFDEYTFTDDNSSADHFGLVLLPSKATKYQNSILCCVITSQEPQRKNLVIELGCDKYRCFNRTSYACFNRKDLQSKSGLSKREQPVGKLNQNDRIEAYKKLKKSLYAIQDIASTWLRATIFREWAKIKTS